MFCLSAKADMASLDVDLVIDATAFDSGRRDHLGCSLRAFQQIFSSQQDALKACLLQAKYGMMAAAARGLHNYRIMLFDKGGRAGSLAVLQILMHLLLKAGHEVESSHLCKWWWNFVQCQEYVDLVRKNIGNDDYQCEKCWPERRHPEILEAAEHLIEFR